MARIFNEKIAKIAPPSEIGLASNPNFVTFESKGDSNIVKRKMKTIISVDADLGNSKKETVHISIEEKGPSVKKQPKIHTFTGTYMSEDTNDKTFLLVDGIDNKAEKPVVSTVYNFVDCLLKNSYIKNNFDVIAPLDTQNSVQVIEIVSKGYGIQYNFDIIITYGDLKKEKPEADSIYKFLSDKNDVTSSISSDSIDSGTGEQQIELDIYANTDALLGDYSDEDEVCETGTYIASLSKSYFGKPLWFDLNALIGKRSSYSTDFLTKLEVDKNKKLWVDSGTMINYRFVAKRTNKKIIEPFYFSDVCYSINGYDYTLNKVDLDDYVLKINQDFTEDDFRVVKPLTINRERTHIEGQRQYFNFIMKDTDHARTDVALHQIALSYKLYTQSGTFIGEKIDQVQASSHFTSINTTLLRLDQFLPIYKEKTVGRIEVSLVASLNDTENGLFYKNIPVSESQSYRILPSYLHKVNDFAFLNRLGGWDSFNFGGSASIEFKTSASTIYKTLTPDFKQHSEIESIAAKTAEEKRTVQTSPIKVEVVEWLRELSASTVVYELSTKRYVIVDDMTLKYNTKDDLFQIEMKYHYSDTFNTKIK